MKQFFKLLLAAIVPSFAYTQVKVQQVTPATITSVMPFYSPGILANTPVKTFTLNSFAKITNLVSNVVDPNDDGDTTNEYTPILDYGTDITANITLTDGAWQIVNTFNSRLWTLKIVIQNAFTTGLQLTNFNLSPTASFFIADSSLSVIKGPYLKEAMVDIPEFATFPLNSSVCYLLLFEQNKSNIYQNNFNIPSVTAGYFPLGENGTNSVLSTGNTSNTVSNSCIPSIKCYPDYMLTARGVARWVGHKINGNAFLASGTLINSQNQDATPYFYTARHATIEVSNFAATTFQFKFWQTGCNTGVNENFIEFMGSTHLYSIPSPDGDASLLRLNNGPGIGDGPTYVGWNRQEGNPGDNCTIIHHPRGDDMRFTGTRSVRNFLWDSDFWRTKYYVGVVLPGSSGSALLNENKQIVGVLYRGSTSCFFPDFGDRFGKFYKAWTGMQQYLSPSNNSSMGSLAISTLAIQGNNVIGCSTAPFTYSFQNLTGCTYTWTSSANLNITGGAGTNSITVVYIGNGQQVEQEWVNLVVNDNKGSFPDGRRAEYRMNIEAGQKINGIIEQQGYPIQQLNTVNFIKPNLIAHTEFTTYACTSTSASLIGGSPVWSFYNYGNYGHLYVNLNAGQSATFNITTTNASCGLISRTITYVASSWGFFFEVNPNPANSFITISATKDVNDKANANRSITELEYNVQIIDLMTGQTVKQAKVNKGQISKKVNVSDLKRGHYIIQITEGINKTIKHIILQ